MKHVIDLGPLQAFTMKRFVKKVINVNLNPSTILAKRSILDAWLDPQCASTAGYNKWIYLPESK